MRFPELRLDRGQCWVLSHEVLLGAHGFLLRGSKLMDLVALVLVSGSKRRFAGEPGACPAGPCCGRAIPRAGLQGMATSSPGA